MDSQQQPQRALQEVDPVEPEAITVATTPSVLATAVADGSPRIEIRAHLDLTQTPGQLSIQEATISITVRCFADMAGFLINYKLLEDRLSCVPLVACDTSVPGDGLCFGTFQEQAVYGHCLLYTSPSPRDATLSRMPSSA